MTCRERAGGGAPHLRATPPTPFLGPRASRPSPVGGPSGRARCPRTQGWALLLACLLLAACTPSPSLSPTIPPTTIPIAQPTAPPPRSPPPTESPRPAAPGPTRPPCTIGSGFERLVRELGRDLAGECVEDERANPATGDVEQRTTRGLLIWHKAENLATFTNGATTYSGCPDGIQRRSSAEPFACGPAAASPVPSPVAAPRLQPPASPSPVAGPAACPNAVPWNQARTQVGRQATIAGPVASTNHARSAGGQPTFVDLGVGFPNPDRFTIVIWGEARSRFPAPPEQLYAGKTVCVSGPVELFRNVPQIQVSSPASITIVDGS